MVFLIHLPSTHLQKNSGNYSARKVALPETVSYLLNCLCLTRTLCACLISDSPWLSVRESMLLLSIVYAGNRASKMVYVRDSVVQTFCAFLKTQYATYRNGFLGGFCAGYFLRWIHEKATQFQFETISIRKWTQVFLCERCLFLGHLFVEKIKYKFLLPSMKALTTSIIPSSNSFQRAWSGIQKTAGNSRKAARLWRKFSRCSQHPKLQKLTNISRENYCPASQVKKTRRTYMIGSLLSWSCVSDLLLI